MRFGLFLLCCVLVMPLPARAAHPLITDDAGTQGKGKFQLEVNGQYDSDKETADGVSVKETGTEAAATLSYGVVDSTDVVVSLPYDWGMVKENGVTTYDEQGISDATFEVKWRFLEKEGFSFALKPGISLPTGDEDKGLGSGKVGAHLFLIGSKEAAPWAFHANLGYIRNENKFDEEENLWHASLAATYDLRENLKLVTNVGAEKNPDKAADNDPAFLIGGIIYGISENVDIDCGVKTQLTSSETDLSLLLGLAYRF